MVGPISSGHDLDAVIAAVIATRNAIHGKQEAVFRDLSNKQKQCFFRAKDLVIVSYMLEERSSASLIFEGCPGVLPLIVAKIDLGSKASPVSLRPFIAIVSATDL